MNLEWNNEKLELCPEKAVYWPAQKILFVADPHFGKAATFRKVGIPVPELTTADDCLRLEKLILRTKPEKLVFLGDFFHARQGRTNPVRTLLFAWRESIPKVELHLVRGNHDIQSGDPWPELEIQCHPDPWNGTSIECRHIPIEKPQRPYLAGHLHPGFTLMGKSRAGIRSACFQVGRDSMILPAFGSFTGLKNIRPQRGDQVFLTDGSEIIKVPTQPSRE